MAPDPTWGSSRADEIFKFRQSVIGAIWPEDFEELKRATITLSILIHRAAQTFMSNSRQESDGQYWPRKFYKEMGWNENYDRDVELYKDWISECHTSIHESTKAVNWFADVVRRDLNPMFFAKEGKFIITEGPFEGLSFRTALLEYSSEEKQLLPDKLAVEKE